MKDQTRNESGYEQHQLALGAMPEAGVGGRHRPTPPAQAGGGYLPSCTSSGGALQGAARAAGATVDPRLQELRAMGLTRAWRNVAQAVGFEAFLTTWRILASDDSVRDDRSRVFVPCFGTFLRFQRNLLIRTMLDEGHKPNQINEALHKCGFDPLSPARIKRLSKRNREAA